MRFGEIFIDMVFRLVSNNWYSMLLNGHANGFFKSRRGVKQGDPLSPTLFILAAHVLGRALDALFDNLNFIGIGMPKWSHNINYLSNADDTIIFCSSHYGAVQLVMNVLGEYEAASGQKINKQKSSFYMHEKAPVESEFRCPIFYSTRQKEFYKNTLFKVQERQSAWKGNGRVKHWASWGTLCLPKYEGGLGFRSMHDISKALFVKLWWNFRATDSLWSAFMRTKYCMKINEVIVPWRRGSHMWRKMLQMRDEVEHQIWWQLKSGNSWFLFDNWTGLGRLYHASGPDHWCDEPYKFVGEVMENGTWNGKLVLNWSRYDGVYWWQSTAAAYVFEVGKHAIDEFAWIIY
ncbi:PREDICTED: uncharacterized protein LOC109205453 [Nicotiana attenuata]|uniref:uncharacterized protein LOC109205453 n=1 Tax=Nicotiana attenuata TaxID=49451 RepID=UPI000904EB37|nr:PREDICTED: uncharacterized protein LOC109205453 [Nicotiana attenuata]